MVLRQFLAHLDQAWQLLLLLSWNLAAVRSGS